MERIRVIVSACLMGIACRYDGGQQAVPDLERLLRCCEAVPVCPEQLGGLSTPRIPAERRGEKVISASGQDITAAFSRGMEQTVRIARLYGARLALLKQRSPSCGSREIYDGSFSGHCVPGMGITAEALSAMGIEIYDETQLEDLIKRLEV